MNINGDDRYCKPTEWWALSQEKRDSILAKRKLRQVTDIRRINRFNYLGK
jgi:hypothetical protein